MNEITSGNRHSTPRLVLVPAVITLGVTILRLVGERQGWSRTWFNPEAGGPGSIVGITWLTPLFGIYFALKLAGTGQGPKSLGRAVGLAFLAVAIIYGLSYAGFALHLQKYFQGRLLFSWGIFALAALVTLPGWPSLFKTMLAYAYTARIPVAVVMLLAFQGDWHTHYDAPPPDMPAGLGLWSKYLWLGFFPQLILWVVFTIVAGMLFGSLATATVRLFRRTSAVPT
jgi:hypothetical protein